MQPLIIGRSLDDVRPCYLLGDRATRKDRLSQEIHRKSSAPFNNLQSPNCGRCDVLTMSYDRGPRFEGAEAV